MTIIANYLVLEVIGDANYVIGKRPCDQSEGKSHLKPVKQKSFQKCSIWRKERIVGEEPGCRSRSLSTLRGRSSPPTLPIKWRPLEGESKYPYYIILNDLNPSQDAVQQIIFGFQTYLSKLR